MERRLPRSAGLPRLALLAAALAAAAPMRAAETRIDLLVTNGTVVAVDPSHRVIAGGAVAVGGGRILAVGPADEVGRRRTAREVLDAGGGLVLPGLVNAHTHAPMVLFRGLADDLGLMDWLNDHIFPAEARHVTAAFVRAGSRLAILEMLLSGTTTFADMYYFEDHVAEAAREAGIRAVLGETVIGFPAPDNPTVPDALRYTERFLERWTGDPLVVPAVAPHSTYLAGPETLQACRALADRFGAPILIHLSESLAEQEQIRGRYGKTPTEHLRDLGVLRKGLVAAHGIYLTASDRAILARAGAGVAHCPQSNMKIAAGIAPVRDMLAEGIRLGIGTDGAASNNDLDMFEEMLTAALLAKVSTGDPTAAPAPRVLEMATLGGARALGLEDEIGSLEVGKRADLIVVSTDAPRLHPLYDPVSQLVYAAKGADVRHVVIGGRLVVRDRVPLTLDPERVLAETARLRASILEGAR
jgi:5-methylthioadenosine/S-adenosylhomocysteine deaminase